MISDIGGIRRVQFGKGHLVYGTMEGTDGSVAVYLNHTEKPHLVRELADENEDLGETKAVLEFAHPESIDFFIDALLEAKMILQFAKPQEPTVIESGAISETA